MNFYNVVFKIVFLMERFDNLDKFFYDVWYLLIKVVIKWKGDY